MKALSIRQPWAWAILHAGKNIENRTWFTHFRGRFLIHASKGWDDEGFTFLRLRCGASIPVKNDFPRGGIVGAATIVDCVTHHTSPWFFGPYGYVLDYIEPLHLPGGRRLIELSGMQKFFKVPDEIAREAA